MRDAPLPNPLSLVLRTAQRVGRYISAWSWLIKYNARQEPLLLLGALFFGICSRLGALIGFILSIRCAMWILNPDSIPGFLTGYLPKDPQMLLVALVAVPGAVFLGLAGAQIIQNTLGLKLRNTVAEDLAEKYTQTMLQDLSGAQLKERVRLSAIAAVIRAAHGKIVTIEALLINLLVTTLGFLLALTGGLLIDWFLMTTIAVIGIIFSGTTAIYRHLKSHVLTEEQESERLREQNELEHLVNLSRTVEAEDEIAAKIKDDLPALLKTMSSQKSVDQKFNNQSTLIIDIGQAAIIVTFLSLLIESSGSAPERISMLIILALMFRFLSSYLQVITHVAIKLSVHYPFLVGLRTKLRNH